MKKSERPLSPEIGRSCCAKFPPGHRVVKSTLIRPPHQEGNRSVFCGEALDEFQPNHIRRLLTTLKRQATSPDSADAVRGLALLEIRERKLFAGTFRDFCREELGLDAPAARRLIHLGQVEARTNIEDVFGRLFQFVDAELPGWPAATRHFLARRLFELLEEVRAGLDVEPQVDHGDLDGHDRGGPRLVQSEAAGGCTMTRGPIPADLSPESLTAVVDTREQAAVDLTPMRTIRGTLATGDYSVVGLESVVSIERKSLSDLLGCIGQERERFEREVQRLLAFPCRALVVEAFWSDIEAGRWQCKVTSAAALGSLLGWVAMGLPVIMAGDHSRAGRYIGRLLFTAARRRWREARALVAGSTGDDR